MDIEFHYYITAIIARHSGFDLYQSMAIAAACQLLDDVDRDIKNDVIEVKRTTANGISADGIEIMLSYHFLPGDFQGDWPIRNKLLVTKDSFLSNLLLQKALSEKNLHFIGTASHTYSDCYAHANFIGKRHFINSSGSTWKLLIPAIGHAEYSNLPDSVNTIWYDQRLLMQCINNKNKFIECAWNLHQIYCKYNKVNCFKRLTADLGSLIGDAIMRNTISLRKIGYEKKYLQYFKETFAEELSLYEELDLKSDLDFLGAFNNAALRHKKFVMRNLILKGIYE